jgi:signal transduction histidine kinase
VNITDIIIYLLFIGIILEITYLPPAPPVRSPIWASKENFRFFATYLVLSVTFFNWFYQPLVIATIFIWVAVLTETKISGQTMLYLPTYIATIVCFFLFSLALEQIKRNSFEAEISAISKESVWKEILNELPEGITVVAKDRTLLYHNPAAITSLNLDPIIPLIDLDSINSQMEISLREYDIRHEDTSSTQPFDLSDQHHSFVDIQEKIWTNWDSLYRTHVSAHSGLPYLAYKGNLRMNGQREKSIDIKFSLKDFAGTPVVFFIFSDISERLAVESLQQTIEYKERLLASVSHELRTPLNGTINFVDAAIQDPRVPEFIKTNFLVPAIRAARYLLTIINDILDFSQVQNQKLRLFPIRRSIVQTIKDALELIEIQAKKKEIALDLERPHEKWDNIFKTDHNRLIQILTNLLSNALKFTFKGSINLKIVQVTFKMLRFEVHDTGIGISKEDQAKLFRAFGKVGEMDRQRYLNPQGVGLGLLISNELSKMLGPRRDNDNPEISDDMIGIHVDSEPGVGSCFWFYIYDMNGRGGESDYVDHEWSPSVNQERHSSSGTNFMRSAQVLPEPDLNACTCPKILIADDDAFNLLALENVLSSFGQKVVTAYNGKGVLDIVESRFEAPCGPECGPYQIVFLDCNMPIMDGYECAGKLKEFSKSTNTQKSVVIACTAAVQASDRQKAMDAGMDDFCEKPIAKPRIRELLNKYMNKK